MNPYYNSWFNARKIIDEKLKSDWVSDHGFIPYLIYGLNSSLLQASDLLFLGSNLSFIVVALVIIAVGFFYAIVIRVIAVNAVYFTGKLWKGQASKNEIDTVVSLSFIPYLIVLIYSVAITIASKGDIFIVSENGILTWIVYIFSLRILIFGIARVQKFSYGLSLLNAWLPQLIIIVIYLFIRGFLRSPQW